MTVTYGFYDSLAGDRKYSAGQMSRMLDGIILDGVFQSFGGGLAVSANTGMTVNVASGRAWFNNTWTHNDATIVLTVDPSESVLNRIDTVVVEVNTDLAYRANTIKIVKGTPGSSPVAPTLASTSTLHQYALANIYVGAGVTSIISGNITNKIGAGGASFVDQNIHAATIKDSLSFGTNPATVGLLRFPNAQGIIISRNAANSADIGAFFVDGSNTVQIGYSGAAGVLIPAKFTSVGLGRAGVGNSDHVVFFAGSADSGVADITTNGSLLNGVGGAFYPSLKMTGNSTGHYGLKTKIYSFADGTTRTVDAQYSLYVGKGVVAANTVATYSYGAFIEAPDASVTAANNIGLYNGGTSWLNGNVGIGALADATFKLYVNGIAKVVVSANSRFDMNEAVAAFGVNGVLFNGLTPDGSGAMPIFFNANQFIFYNGHVSIGTITDLGLLGINTPSATLAFIDATNTGSTKASPGTVSSWVEIKIGGSTRYIPAYSSKTS